VVCVLNACLLQHSDATYAGIHHHIANRLKTAPHRQGGADKGCCIQLRILNGESEAIAGDLHAEDVGSEDDRLDEGNADGGDQGLF